MFESDPVTILLLFRSLGIAGFGDPVISNRVKVYLRGQVCTEWYSSHKKNEIHQSALQGIHEFMALDVSKGGSAPKSVFPTSLLSG
ncbi:hypothetical protein GGS20DRAFT_160477 [Poronia punctata]|nr:hypothetical protein GGS20DRAFT_160477 [Poronia punctata]